MIVFTIAVLSTFCVAFADNTTTTTTVNVHNHFYDDMVENTTYTSAASVLVFLLFTLVCVYTLYESNNRPTATIV